jgi:hypothetical protein
VTASTGITGKLWLWRLFVVAVVLLPVFAYAAVDQACLQRAVTDRSNTIKDAYKEYADDMAEAVDRLTKGQNDAIALKDSNQRQTELTRLQSVYANDIMQVAQTVTYKTEQAWTDYQYKQSLCGETGNGSTHGAATYPYGYPSYGSSYGYPYNSYNSYNYGYGYPYTYGYGNSYQYNRGYWPYGSSYCPQVLLTTPPTGCGYECRYDGNGCQTCELSCRRTNGVNNNCLCPQYYSPVCGRDARTYDNSCSATCAGVAITHYGQC